MILPASQLLERNLPSGFALKIKDRNYGRVPIQSSQPKKAIPETGLRRRNLQYQHVRPLTRRWTLCINSFHCSHLRQLYLYPSGQDGAILPARDCPFCSGNKISPKTVWVQERFLSQNFFRENIRQRNMNYHER